MAMVNTTSAPVGLPQEIDPETIEIEVEDPEGVKITAGDVEIELRKEDIGDEKFDRNLAEEMDPGKLATLASELSHDIDTDRQARREWEKMYAEGLKLLGLNFEDRTQPWEGACGVFHPLIIEAVIRFQSETIVETFPASGPVRTQIVGEETPENRDAAMRVESDMNLYCTKKMLEFRNEHERMLFNLAPTGCAFKKVYYDPSLGRPVSMFVSVDDVLLPYGTTDIFSAERITHVMKKTETQMLRLMDTNFYREIKLGEPDRHRDDIARAKDKETGFNDINDERHTLYECIVDLDLPGFEDTDEDGDPTGLPLPYVVTMLRGTNDVLSIRRNWREGDKLHLRRHHFVQYDYVPGMGPYGHGLFHIIGGYAKAATSITRQLVDAGTLSNLPGGLKTRGLRIKGDDTPIAPGEWRDVDVASGVLRDNLMPLPYKEPSAVLAGMLDKMVMDGRKTAATADLNVSDLSANAPVGSVLAVLERQLKPMTAIQARVHNSFTRELQLIGAIIRDYTDDDYEYVPENAAPQAKKEDYAHVEILPVSDPNMATMAQRVITTQAALQMAQMHPEIYNMPELHRTMLDVMRFKNASKIIPMPDDLIPRDPVTENMAFMRLQPTKAFFYQDHNAHITSHMSMMQDPTVAALIGQNPKASMIQAALTAHVAEHVGYAYRQQIEQRLGFPLPPEDMPLPPEVEMQLSSMIAQAANQVLQQNQAAIAQQQQAQQAQDPVLQLQQQELQLKQQESQNSNQMKTQELQLKQQQMQINQLLAQVKQQELTLKQQQMQIKAAEASDRISLDSEQVKGNLQLGAMKVSAQAQSDKGRLKQQGHIAGMQAGIDVAKHKAEQNAQRRQQLSQLASAMLAKQQGGAEPAKPEGPPDGGSSPSGDSNEGAEE